MSWQQPPVVSTQRGVSVPAIVVVGVGVVAIAVSLFVLGFFNSDAATFSELRDAFSGSTGFAAAWFGWIAYASAAAAVLLAVLTLLPSSARPGLRAASVIVSIGSIVLSFVALADAVHFDRIDWNSGFWAEMIGFLLLAIGSTIRPPTQVAVTTTYPAGVPGQWGGQPTTGQTWSGQQPIAGQQWGGQQPVAQPWTPQQPTIGQTWGQQAADPWAATVPAAGVGQPAIPAGWHPDPTGRNEQRWWDGQRWTAHVVRGGMQTSDPI